MAKRRSKASSQFKTILQKIESGDLPKLSDAEIELHRHRREKIRISCENCDYGDATELSPSEFVDWLHEGEISCPECGEEFSTENLDVRCANCDADIDYLDLAHLSDLLGDICPECESRYGITGFRQIYVHGSWDEARYLYEWTEESVPTDPLNRPNRTDYWEGLVHFCEADEFIAIYKDRKIRASTTGRYRKKAVCLTEATRLNWGELSDRHGEYGFIFRKRDLIRLDAAPAIYLPQTLLDEMRAARQTIPEMLRPYVNKLSIPRHHSTRHDFLHEREWRVPQDIEFDGDDGVRPYAVTFPNKRPGLPDENLVLDAAREFHELTEEKPS